MSSYLANYIEQNIEKYSYILESAIDYRFSDMGLLKIMLTHSSLKNENPNLISQDNEKLEFIGDSVFDLVVSKFLYDSDPSMDEGDLTVKRANIVKEQSLAKFARKLKLQDYIMTSKSGQMTNITSNDSVLADGFEAVVGGLFLDCGYEKTEAVLINSFADDFCRLMDSYTKDFKSELCVYIGKKALSSDEYRLVETIGPGHDMTFVSEFYLDGKMYGRGVGKSKKASEAKAAEMAIKNLEKRYGPL